MKHLFLFENFLSYINEMDLIDPHYFVRTTKQSFQSRIVPFSDRNTYGFKVDVFIDDRGKAINFDEVEKATDTDGDTINFYISETLSYLTQNKKLELWKPKNKSGFQNLDLGRICLDFYGYKYYPLIQAGNGKGGFHDSGDNVWLSAVDNIKAKTIKFYKSDIRGKDLSFSRSKNNAEKVHNIEGDNFKNDHARGYPYGTNFSVKIDLTEEDRDLVLRDIKFQILRACKV